MLQKKINPIHLRYLSIGLACIYILSLNTGWLNFLAVFNINLGIDYFPYPKGALNLLEGRSMFDSYGGTWFAPGYSSTWYITHPLYAVTIMPFFALFPFWTSYMLFCAFQIAIMYYCASLITKLINNEWHKEYVFMFFLAASPTLVMLQSGNLHSLIVLSLTLLFLGLWYLYQNINTPKALKYIFLGLLLSLFTKPVVIPLIPMLLLFKNTRKHTIMALGIYGVVSILLWVIPFFNPQSIGFEKVWFLATHPDFVKENLNMYKNNLKLNEYMLDNSIHWMSMIARSDDYLDQFQVLSFHLFLDKLLSTKLSAFIFKIPVLLTFGMSLMVLLIKTDAIKKLSVLFAAILTSLVFFMSYSTPWEYQYTAIMPVIGFGFVFFQYNIFSKDVFQSTVFMAILIAIPMLYFIFGTSITDDEINLCRGLKLLPAIMLWVIILGKMVGMLRLNLKKK